MIFPDHESRTKSVVRVLVALAMTAIGIFHFVRPEPFEKIVPAYLPAAHALVLFSGLFEVAGGVGLLLAPVRVAAAWGLVALYVAVFPANVNMAVHQIQIDPTHPMPVWGMWARLPFQALFIGVAVWLARPSKAPSL
ncbi:MAG: hypothetical protein ACHREM_23320 [Polyangiales bacterium]